MRNCIYGMTYEISPELTLNQKQILYGTILGGSSLIRPLKGKNCYLAMRDRDYNWLRYKIEELKNFFKMDSKVIKQDKNTYRSYSIAYPVFNEIHDDFATGINENVLDLLNDVAWMVWFIDAGNLNKNKAYLRTTKFKEAGTQLIQKYFCSLDCDCAIRCQDNSYSLVFTENGTQELFKIISHRMPRFILDRFS